MNTNPASGDGLTGKKVRVTKAGGSFSYSYTGTCLAYYIEPNPMGGGEMGAAIHVQCRDGKSRNLHVYPGMVMIEVLPNSYDYNNDPPDWSSLDQFKKISLQREGAALL
jgi:hypothetical protein